MGVRVLLHAYEYVNDRVDVDSIDHRYVVGERKKEMASKCHKSRLKLARRFVLSLMRTKSQTHRSCSFLNTAICGLFTFPFGYINNKTIKQSNALSPELRFSY